MPAEIAILTQDGIQSASLQADSLRQVASMEPEGVYTITRTYQTDKCVLLDAHIDRLVESARLEGIDLKLDRGQLRRGLRQLIKMAGYRESRLRVTIPHHQPNQILLAAEPLAEVPESLRRQGVVAATVSLERNNPRAKSNTWEKKRAEAAEGLPAGAYEGLLVDDRGRILEGFSSNFYGVLDGDLHTADEDILRGISRRILLKVLPERITLITEAVKVTDIAQLVEAFITSSSRGVLPVVSIDGIALADGNPGPITMELCDRYDRWVQEHLEPI